MKPMSVSLAAFTSSSSFSGKVSSYAGTSLLLPGLFARCLAVVAVSVSALLSPLGPGNFSAACRSRL